MDAQTDVSSLRAHAKISNIHCKLSFRFSVLAVVAAQKAIDYGPTLKEILDPVFYTMTGVILFGMALFILIKFR